MNRQVMNVVLGGALVAACGLVVLLSHRLNRLSADYRELRQLSTLPHAGTVVPAFRAATLSGDSVTVGEAADSGDRQVLFVFNTTCPFCRATVPIWQHLADSLKGTGGHVQVLAISLHSADSTRTYVRELGLRYPVLRFPDRKLERLYRTVAVPQTVVLDGTGAVRYAKTGTLDSGSLDSVYAAALGHRER